MTQHTTSANRRRGAMTVTPDSGYLILWAIS